MNRPIQQPAPNPPNLFKPPSQDNSQVPSQNSMPEASSTHAPPVQ